MLIIALISTIVLYAQNRITKEELIKQIAEVESEIERLQNVKSYDKGKNTYSFEKIVYQQQKSMNDHEFEQFCKVNFQNFNKVATGCNYLITCSCQQTSAGIRAHFCISVVPNVANDKHIYDQVSRQKKLQKIRNTKAMYTDLIRSLTDELKSNGIEIIDQTSNLAVKHLDIKGITGSLVKNKMKDMKDNMILTIKHKYGLSEEGIKNENAQIIDDMTNQAENLMSFIPGASLLTCHYLWRILKSTPEVGKIIGNTTAAINIYFQLDEFNKKLEQLEADEKRLSNSN